MKLAYPEWAQVYSYVGCCAATNPQDQRWQIDVESVPPDRSICLAESTVNDQYFPNSEAVTSGFWLERKITAKVRRTGKFKSEYVNTIQGSSAESLFYEIIVLHRKTDFIDETVTFECCD